MCHRLKAFQSKHLIEYMFMLFVLNQTIWKGLGFTNNRMAALVVPIHRWRSFTTKHPQTLTFGFRLQSTTSNNEDRTVDKTKIVGKTDGYSKLPRLYVGSIPSEPIRCTDFQEMGQLLKSSSQTPALCHEKAILDPQPLRPFCLELANLRPICELGDRVLSEEIN